MRKRGKKGAWVHRSPAPSHKPAPGLTGCGTRIDDLYREADVWGGGAPGQRLGWQHPPPVVMLSPANQYIDNPGSLMDRLGVGKDPLEGHSVLTGTDVMTVMAERGGARSWRVGGGVGLSEPSSDSGVAWPFSSPSCPGVATWRT